MTLLGLAAVALALSAPAQSRATELTGPPVSRSATWDLAGT
jgi:hypothetical protein